MERIDKVFYSALMRRQLNKYEPYDPSQMICFVVVKILKKSITSTWVKNILM